MSRIKEPGVKEQVIALLKEGKTRTEIHAITGVPIGTLNGVAQAHGIVQRGTRSKAVRDPVPAPYARGLRWFNTKWA